ncbi:Uncharacterised protein [Serratia entomophila]|jgi:hypothetical protein|uniref:Uncharacterized protein n=1 Tax=Serratia entomophila TaxID=42906 RepID=A0ABY5CZQ7_9GAMM|nr:hypothetical protein [Serratia entomophila]UIW20643.1 hypothetical protein KHA73_12215 [Serratia entomophila]USV03150.1 hypothetical protein KFQ06_11860 [Serratia entomophila]CAI0713864.1 Uncharacterised protein [Serratia entomophila]CAI0780707.1 Uncharacterised protein [Serratia entomophila]CAI0799556.1 Uncharacterised protein [Serratia entomophila]
MFIRTLVRFAALSSAISIFIGATKWPDDWFIGSVVMLAVWLHAEWDWWKNK